MKRIGILGATDEGNAERIERGIAALQREPEMVDIPPPPRLRRPGLIDALAMAAAATGSGLGSILPRHEPTFPPRTSEESRRALAAAEEKRAMRARKMKARGTP